MIMIKNFARILQIFYWFLIVWMTASVGAVGDSPQDLEKPCELGWVPYDDDYCIKLFDAKDLIKPQMPYTDAEARCKKHDAFLVSIEDKKKQSFLESYLQLKKITAANIWIGLRAGDNKTYRWSDDTSYDFKNWVKDGPKNEPTYCVQMHSDPARFGKWSDALCNQANLILCQKIQVWSMLRQQKEVITLSKQLSEVMINFIPIGFIYFQYPWQKEPKYLYPSTVWSDISGEYAGLFFRALGGDSSYFGNTQYEDYYRLTDVKKESFSDWQKREVYFSNNHWSEYTLAGFYPKGAQVYYYNAIGFYNEHKSVRPYNYAIKIWKRIN